MNDRHLLQGQCGISYFPQTSGFIEPDPGAGALVLTVMTTSRFLDDYFRYADKETPQAFFGQPVFEHFRDYRLERAREMLATGEVRVSEAAYPNR